MPDTFVVIGGAKTRKSALIRALSGASFRSQYGIEDSSSTVRNFFVQVRSLQEADILPVDFMSEVRSQNLGFVLVALRIDGINRKPDGVHYITAFLNAGWNIRGLAILGPGRLTGLPTNCLNPIRISGPSSRAANEIASVVRLAWGRK